MKASAEEDSLWQEVLAQGFGKVSELLAYLQLPPTLGNEQAALSFKTRVPRRFAARMKPGDPLDPLLLQVLPTTQELDSFPGYSLDPLEEFSGSQPASQPGLLQKYAGRVLLPLTGACAIHCRYCFRRHFPYEDNNLGRAGWLELFDQIAQDTTIREIILSGGDPLLLTDGLLQSLIQKMVTLPQLKTLRFHSRVPVVLPERITNSFLNLFSDCPLKKVMVLHCNHPQEITPELAKACRQLRAAGFLLLNQSVLLRQVNDKADVLAALSEELFAMDVLPYYLHLLDKVVGAAHFDVAQKEALVIYQQLQTRLPGYLLPRLVREEPLGQSKTLII